MYLLYHGRGILQIRQFLYIFMYFMHDMQNKLHKMRYLLKNSEKFCKKVLHFPAEGCILIPENIANTFTEDRLP